MIMASASNLMTLYLGLELQSLALYVLAAFARDDVRSSEAGLKYFVLSGLASGLLLYGISLVYGFSGTMDFQALHGALLTPAAAPPGLIVGVVFVVVGLAFGIAGALALGRILEGMLFGVRAGDPWTLGGVSGVLIAVAAAACYVPALRVTRADPLTALRYE